MPADNMQADMASGPTVGGINIGEVLTQSGEAFSFNGLAVTAHAASANFNNASPAVVAVTVAKTNSSPYGFSSSDADKVVTFVGTGSSLLADLYAKYNALITELRTKGFVAGA